MAYRQEGEYLYSSPQGNGNQWGQGGRVVHGTEGQTHYQSQNQPMNHTKGLQYGYAKAYKDSRNDRHSDSTLTPSMAESQQSGLKGKNRKSKIEGQKRFCCGIFERKSACVRVVTAVVALIMVGLGLLGFFLYPRIPQVTISAPTNANLGRLSTGSIASASESNPFTVNMQLSLPISVYSTNYIAYSFENIGVTAKLTEQGTVVGGQIGNGDSGKVNFPPNKNTTFILPFNLTLSLTAPLTSLESNPQLQLLMSQCGTASFPDIEPAAKVGFIAIALNMSLSSKFLNWTGFVPSIAKNMEVPCPPSTVELAKLLASIIKK